jgi:hypothetical protein
MIGFKKFLSEQPVDIGDIKRLDNKLSFRKNAEEYAYNNLNKNKKMLFKKYFYSEDNNFLAIWENDILILFIEKDIRSNNKTIFIKIIQKYSSEKNLSFKIYLMLLNVYEEVITGDYLSKDNIKAHKRYLKEYNTITKRNLKTKVETSVSTIDKLNNKDEVYVLKRDALEERSHALIETYNSPLANKMLYEDVINFLISELLEGEINGLLIK